MDTNSLEQRVLDLEAQVRSLQTNVTQLQQSRVSHYKVFDTFIFTPWWKRIVFALDGWSWHQIQHKPQWRPWHPNARFRLAWSLRRLVSRVINCWHDIRWWTS